MAVDQRFSTAVILTAGVRYAVVDLMMMLQMLHVDNQDIYDPMMCTASMLKSNLLFAVYVPYIGLLMTLVEQHSYVYCMT